MPSTAVTTEPGLAEQTAHQPELIRIVVDDQNGIVLVSVEISTPFIRIYPRSWSFGMDKQGTYGVFAVNHELVGVRFEPKNQRFTGFLTAEYIHIGNRKDLR